MLFAGSCLLAKFLMSYVFCYDNCQVYHPGQMYNPSSLLLPGQVVVVGGSDGSHSIVSSEIFDAASNSWILGPPLITPRANLSVVVMGSRLYAIGGFSGKKFLSSLEWLDMEDMEWFGHTPRDIGPQPGSNDQSPRDVSQ